MDTRFFDFSDKDILTPEIQNINGMYFRVNPITAVEKSKTKAAGPGQYEELPSDPTEELSPDELDVLYHRMSPKGRDGTYRLLLDKEFIPSALFPMIIGRGGQAKKAIEDSTKARIVIPDKQNQLKPIEIYSYEDRQLLDCWRRLIASAQTARLKTSPTHFLCFPVANEEISKNYGLFRNSVNQRCGGARGFSDGLFQKTEKLHLTIGVLSLFDGREYDLAASELDASLSGLGKAVKGPLVCRVRGLEIMNDDPSQVDVLYSVVEDSSGTVQRIANKVYRHFAKASPRLMHQQFDHLDGVKLHVTLVNSGFRKGEEVGEADADGRSRKTFDATQILEEFKDFDFGLVEIKEVHISQRFSFDSKGFYKATRKFDLDARLFSSDDGQRSSRDGDSVAECYGDEPECDDEFAGEM